MAHMHRWKHSEKIRSRPFSCGYCGVAQASELGYVADLQVHKANYNAYIYICHQCHQPNYFAYDGKQYPAGLYGGNVPNVDDDGTRALFEEARVCIGAGAFNAAVMCCRKLLMHIAVAKGADEGKSFKSYVEFFADKHYLPPDATEWVDHIRDKGNDANHQITLMGETDAKDLLQFSEMLLRILYEFPATIRARKTGA